MTPERLNQVQELYHSAREREPAQRKPFLAIVCKDDPELRSEVESLLAADPAHGCFLDEPVMQQAAGLLVSQQSSSAYHLAPGLELGPYVIESRVGAGGMGEVFQARDKRLHRTVALKVLPHRLADTSGLRQRLESEAAVIASLNDPRICTLYDIGREGDIDYLVMEFLEGETLAQRLKRGALPLRELLDVAVRIAGALAAAHAKGIVHRDLKPANIMLTKSGAKLLDFGLAKVRGANAGHAAEMLTSPGTVVGTVQYMSPEQIHGQEADARSDLFAFGATLYEMLTGQRAFAGASQMAVASAILDKDPPAVNDVQPLTPPALVRVVNRCLAKDPENRWQNSSDLLSELQWIKGSPVKPVQVLVKRPSGERLYQALAILFLLAAIISAISYWRLARRPGPAIIAEIPPPPNVRLNSASSGGSLAVSPDGRTLAFCPLDESGKTMLWVRSLDSFAARSLAGTEGAAHPFWSPDSRRLAFFTGSELKSIDAAGGPALFIAASTPVDGGGSWSRDGTILFVPDVDRGVYKMSAAGGTPVPVITAGSQTSGYFAHPRFLPDGKHFLYSYGNGPASGGTYFASVNGTDKHLILGANTFAMYASGYLLYVREGNLLAQAFDPERGQLKGDQPQRAGEHVSRPRGFIDNSFDVSESGILTYWMDSVPNEQRLTWFDRAGKTQGLTGEPADYWDLRLSPDGRKLASNSGSPNSEIWVDDLVREVRMRLTVDSETDSGVPVWFPDSSRIAFAVLSGKHKGIYQKYWNRTGSPELLLPCESDSTIWPTSWSRDGRFLLYSQEVGAAEKANIEIRIFMAGNPKTRSFIKAQAAVYDGQFSPDGKMVAYTSEESTRAEVYIVPFESDIGEGDRLQVSAGGGRSPRWRGDGKEIFYLSPTNQLMAVLVGRRGQSVAVGRAQPLFRSTPIRSIPESAPYDVSDDGRKFVINSLSDDKTSLILLLNWTAHLK